MRYVARQSGVGKRCHYDNLITCRTYRVLQYIYANCYVTLAPQHNLLASIYVGASSYDKAFSIQPHLHVCHDPFLPHTLSFISHNPVFPCTPRSTQWPFHRHSDFYAFKTIPPSPMPGIHTKLQFQSGLRLCIQTRRNILFLISSLLLPV